MLKTKRKAQLKLMQKAKAKATLKTKLKAMLKAMLRANCQLPTGSNGNWGVIHKDPLFRES